MLYGRVFGFLERHILLFSNVIIICNKKSSNHYDWFEESDYLGRRYLYAKDEGENPNSFLNAVEK